MRFLIKLMLLVLVVGAAAFVGFAYVGDLSPGVTSVTEPVVLDVD